MPRGPAVPPCHAARSLYDRSLCTLPTLHGTSLPGAERGKKGAKVKAHSFTRVAPGHRGGMRPRAGDVRLEQTPGPRRRPGLPRDRRRGGEEGRVPFRAPLFAPAARRGLPEAETPGPDAAWVRPALSRPRRSGAGGFSAPRQPPPGPDGRSLPGELRRGRDQPERGSRQPDAAPTASVSGGGPQLAATLRLQRGIGTESLRGVGNGEISRLGTRWASYRLGKWKQEWADRVTGEQTSPPPTVSFDIATF